MRRAPISYPVSMRRARPAREPATTPRLSRYEFRGKNIADVLALTVDAAWEFFSGEQQLRRSIDVLREVGLGYLRLGQPATELSGGEAQRIKLATELQRVQRGATLYVLDEPTTGLHAADVDKLMAQLDALVASGNTVIVVEHDMRVVAGSDWVMDIGPNAGDEGGRVVASGTPAEIAAHLSQPNSSLPDAVSGMILLSVSAKFQRQDIYCADPAVFAIGPSDARRARG